jgi:hypothetical protein
MGLLAFFIRYSKRIAEDEPEKSALNRKASFSRK